MPLVSSGRTTKDRQSNRAFQAPRRHWISSWRFPSSLGGQKFRFAIPWAVSESYKGIRHAYIKPRSPQLNGKVERSHRSDSQEFYQLLSYKGDIDLKAKLAEWERTSAQKWWRPA